MTDDRYVVTSRAGQEVLRTNSLATAEASLAILGGEIIDRHAPALVDEVTA